jgi:hypothetical protein
MSSCEITGNSGDAAGREENAMVASSLPKATDKVCHFLTSAWIAPILGLHEKEVGKEVKAMWILSVPESDVNLLGVERIQGIPLSYLDAGNERKEKTNEVLQRTSLVV